MKSIIVCDPNINEGDINGHKVVIDENKYLFTLLDIPFDEHEANLKEYSVAVKINAFSCNYRDKGVLYHFYKKLVLLKKCV